MSDDVKKCPRCAEEIKAEANVCRYCKAQFIVAQKGYCQNCHKVVEVHENDRCRNCNSEVQDKHLESSLIEVRTTPPSVSGAQVDWENTSGQGAAAQVPPEIRKWNWGAFLLTWIWGIANETYLAFLALVPYVGIVIPFVLGAKGSEWAWRNKRWQSIEEFKRAQKNWAAGGLVVLLVFLLVVPISLLIVIPATMGYRARSGATVCKSNMKTLGTAEEAYYTDKGDTYTLTLTDLSDYVQDFTIKSKCPTGDAAYTVVAGADGIAKSYVISCSTATPLHNWTVETGATLVTP